MTDKEKRQVRQSEEDAVFNRMLLCMLGVIIAEAVVLFIKRFYIDITPRDFDIAVSTFLYRFFGIFMFLGLVLTVLGVIWCVISKKNGKKIRVPVIVTAVVAYIWILSVLGRVLYETGIRIMMVLPIVAAVLILIYFLYQRAFFVNAILTGCGMAGLWLFRQYFDGHRAVTTALFVVGWIVLIAVAILAAVLKKRGGKLGKVQMVNDQKSYVACWLTCAVVIVATVLALVLGSGFAFYLIYALIGWLFCLAVYYTVKLI